MPTTVKIIEVDLGINIDDVINQGVVELSGQAKQELDAAIELAKTTKKLKEEKEATQQAAKNAVQSAMDAAYERLISCQVGVPVDEIMGIVKPHIPNSSAFTLRMKKILSTKGNEYVIGRKKISGIPHYVFTPFNKETPTEPDS